MNKNETIKSSASTISTPVQAGFHLNQGNVLVMEVTRFIYIFITKDNEKDGNYKLALVPLFGKARMYDGNFKAVAEMINEYEFYAVKLSDLEKKNTGILDKMIYSVNLMMGKGCK